MEKFNRYMIYLCAALLLWISVVLIVDKSIPALMALFK